MPLKLTSDPLENERKLSAIAKTARQANNGKMGSLETSWSENLKHLTGLLIDMTHETMKAVSGGYKHSLQPTKPQVAGEPVALNLILPRASRFIARHMNLMGGVQAIAATDDPKDERQAKAAARLMQAMWDNKGLDIAAMKALVFMLGCEHGYIMVEGDPKAKYRHDKDESGNWQAYDVGDVVWRVLYAGQVSVYPGIADIQDSDAIVIEDYVTREYLKRRWNITAPDEGNEASYGVEALDSLVPELKKVCFKIRRLFIKPSPTRPLGEHHVIMGESVIHSTKLPDGRLTIGTYDFKYPIVDFQDAPISFGYQGYGRQSAARTVVKILCSTWSRMVQCAVGMPGVIVDIPENSDISEESLGNSSYLLIYRNPQGGPVGFNAVPGMPLHQSLIENCIRWLDEIYVQSPASRGQAPGTRFPAKGLQFLAQQDVLADTPTGKMVLKAMHNLFRRALGEGLEVWDDEHVEHILGEGHELEKIALKKGDLRQGYDIFVLPGSGTLESKEAQRPAIISAFKEQLLKPADARKFAGFNVKEVNFEPQRLQERIVGLEEETLMAGGPVHINDYDDHEYHIPEHKRSAARRHGMAGDQEKLNRQRHTVEHIRKAGQQEQAILADQAAAEMEMQMMGEGPPPDQGATEPPLPGESVGIQ